MIHCIAMYVKENILLVFAITAINGFERWSYSAIERTNLLVVVNTQGRKLTKNLFNRI